MSKVLGPLLFLATVGLFDVLLMMALSGLGLLGWSVWPVRARDSLSRLVGAPSRCVVLGLVDVLGSILLVILVSRLLGGVGRLLAVVLLLTAVGLLLVGLPGLLSALGERVLVLADRAGSRALATGVGAVVLCAAGLFPWVGQAVLFLALLAAIGAAAMAALGR